MKYLLVALLIVTLGLLGKTAWDKYQTKQLVTQLNKELMAANLEIGKAHTQFGDANKHLGELEKQLQTEIKAKDEVLKMYGVLEAKYKAIGNGSGTTTVVKEVPVPIEVTPGAYYFGATTNKLFDLGDGLYFVAQDDRIYLRMHHGSEVKDDHMIPTYDWSYQLDLKVAGKIVQTIAPSGAVNNYLSVWEVDKSGKKIGNFELTKYEVVVDDQREAKYFWWAPHLDLGAVGSYILKDGKGLVGGSVGFTTSGYGLTKNDLSLRFPMIGVFLGENTGFEIAPFLYNIGGPIPLISNLWVGPIQIWEGGKSSYGLVLNVVL